MFYKDYDLRQKAKAMLSKFQIVYPDEIITDYALDYMDQKLRRQVPDALIYGTARANELVLITRNTKDFDQQDPYVFIAYERES